jgi:hypothetical protein
VARTIRFCFVLVLASCGTDPSPRPDSDAGRDADVPDVGGDCSAPRAAVVVTSDFTTGGVSVIDLESLTSRRDLVTVHPDATVSCACGVVAVLERLGGDDLTLLDPRTLAPVSQVSLGRRTNPQDLWLESESAVVSLHETGEVVRVDLRSGEVVARADLGSLADADGEPEPAALTVSDGAAFVVLQLLDRDSVLWDPTGPATVAVLSADTLELESSFALEGWNPVTRLQPGPDEATRYIGHAGVYADPDDGGIERIDLVGERSLGMAISGAELGGNVIDFAIVGDRLGVAVVNVAGEEDLLVSFDPSIGVRLEVLATAPPYTLVRVIHEPARRRVLVAARDMDAPGIRIFEIPGGREVLDTPLSTGLPPVDLCLLPEPPLTISDADADADADQEIDADGDPVPPRTGRFATEVVGFEPAEGATFGGESMPDIVLGPPEGGGASIGSLDVVSLGCGGSIVLRFDPPIPDVPASPDFLVFENPVITPTGTVFAEPGHVSVSVDGESFVEFPCLPEPSPPIGCAGVTPVLSSSSNGLDATDPAIAGGDAYDLADIDLAEAGFVRIIDRSAENPGASVWCGGSSAGFDLDSVAVVGSAE